MKIYKKNKMIGVYPCIDHLNLALNFLLEDAVVNIEAIEEICYAIEKANGYYYDYVFETLIEKGIKNKAFH